MNESIRSKLWIRCSDFSMFRCFLYKFSLCNKIKLICITRIWIISQFFIISCFRSASKDNHERWMLCSNLESRSTNHTSNPFACFERRASWLSENIGCFRFHYEILQRRVSAFPELIHVNENGEIIVETEDSYIIYNLGD